ncbi:MAG: carboxylating nicotinate-nucleotide diphosphorylase [Ignavibacteriae bacterium]|nr:carboxylating nicotinate-nucleotide diphosphorylase [Ignavibacteriota bacterium]
MNFDFKQARKLIKLALKEDIGSGDVTSDNFISKDSVSKADILVKENGVIAGLKIFQMVFNEVDPKVKVRFRVKDGAKVRKGQIIGEVSGKSRSILKAERVGLNLLQRMSGIATQAMRAKEALGDDRIRVVDTRKTTPNLRLLEKLAVRMGGGANHREGLYDMILIKDNHIEASGGLEKTIEKIKKIRKKTELKIEVEVKNLREFKLLTENAKGLVDRVMLDNFSIADVRKAIRGNNAGFEIEISGGVNLKNINKYKGIRGIGLISMGSLTHSVKSMDIALDFK